MNEARVLVVDDEAAMLRSVERILDRDHEVRGEQSATAALELARDFKPQLAVVDIQMPEMSGFDLMNALKQEDPDVQVILMTGSLYDIDDKLIRAIREKAFYYITKPFDREVLRALVHRCLELRQLEDANRRHVRRLERELAAARVLQQAMLPAKHATIEGIEIRAHYLPCDELAGDLYDYAAAGPGRVALLIADVVGHGASAAMLTSIVKSAFHASRAETYDPVAVVRRVSEGIAPFDAARFVTLLAVRILAKERVMEYVNAGHQGGLLARRDGTAAVLGPTGPIVSPALPGMTWDRKRLEWTGGSLLLLYTDGIAERGGDEEQFGVERIHEAAVELSGDIRRLGLILEEADRFAMGRPPGDDMTLLAARILD